MFVPAFAPRHSESKSRIINKTIVYSDTVLNLKEKGENLKVTSVRVDKYSFERCINMIVESNPDVVFNTVQYSYQYEKAFFYTDKPITTEKWDKRSEVYQEHLIDYPYLERHIKELVSRERTSNPEVIAIYDILMLAKKVYSNDAKYKAEIKRRINYKLKNISDNYSVVIHDMDFKMLELSIEISWQSSHLEPSYEKISFKKNQNDLYISEYDGSTFSGDEILKVIGEEISDLYDYQLKDKYKLIELNIHAQSINSIFSVSMGYYGTNIYIKDFWSTNFRVVMSSYSDKIDYKCNSEKLIHMLKGNEYDLYKKIFVKIDDCPFWMKDELRQLRNEQLVEEEKEREEQEKKRIKEEYKKLKKQERREFWRKIFPFIK